MRELDFGRLFMVGFYGTAFCPELHNFLLEINPAGVILFSRNIVEPQQVAELNFSIQKFAIEKLGRPLFIGIDQESGRVARLKSPFSEFPPAMTIVQTDVPEKAVRLLAETTARELLLVGFNLDFVPVSWMFLGMALTSATQLLATARSGTIRFKSRTLGLF